MKKLILCALLMLSMVGASAAPLAAVTLNVDEEVLKSISDDDLAKLYTSVKDIGMVTNLQENANVVVLVQREILSRASHHAAAYNRADLR